MVAFLHRFFLMLFLAGAVMLASGGGVVIAFCGGYGLAAFYLLLGSFLLNGISHPFKRNIFSAVQHRELLFGLLAGLGLAYTCVALLFHQTYLITNSDLLQVGSVACVVTGLIAFIGYSRNRKVFYKRWLAYTGIALLLVIIQCVLRDFLFPFPDA